MERQGGRIRWLQQTNSRRRRACGLAQCGYVGGLEKEVGSILPRFERPVRMARGYKRTKGPAGGQSGMG